MKALILIEVFWVTLNCTAYAPTGNHTASGVTPQIGHCAVDKINGRVIPFGTRLTLPNGQILTVTDRFGDGRNNALDIFMSNEQECWQFGRQFLRCRIEVAE